MPLTVGLISLGCPKNLVDSEIMIGHLQKAGMTMTPEPELADVMVVNTCAFIDQAKQEAIDAILDIVRARENGAYPENQKLIVAGCLSQRFRKELPALLPEVDAFIGPDQITKLPEIITQVMDRTIQDRNFIEGKCRYVPDWNTPRYRLTPPHTAYIKIAEGCNHGCAYCIIPMIRGRHRSRSQQDVVREAETLIRSGVKEICLIAQDITYYGMDKWTDARPNRRSAVDSSRGESLASLLRALNAIEGEFWIRLLYTHPAHWSDELTAAIAECPKVARYVDIPLQHISDNMLEAMQRVTDGDYIRTLLRNIRKAVPGIAIRTTFITGFPGETEDDHQELMEFIEEFRFERAGIFTFSREEGTKAYKMPNQVHHRTKARRYNEATLLLARLASETGQEQIGRQIRVLVDEAAARLKIELDSMPTEIDQIEREAMQLEMERQALAKEEDADSKARLEKITKDLADLKEKSGSMIAKWKSEKEVLDAVRREQEKIEALKLESERAKRMGDLTRASEITYGELPEAQRALAEGKEKLSKMQKEDGGLLKEEVTEGDIAKVVATWTGIPAARLQEGERAKLVHMEERLGARVIGQKQAVKAVSDAVRRARAGLQDENRPIGSFLFLGPTGVGKTELSKALAEFLFDNENAIVRIDMSEYMEKHSVARLIGAPPGYVGYEEGGQLSEAVRRRPYCVVLFDEIEKAHPDVFNVLLQVLDDGRITDGQGRTVDFRNTVIIMTSNIGSQYILNEANAEQREAKALEALRGHFRPEFLNRIDEIIIFDRLTAQELKGIVDIQLQRVRRRLEAKGLFLRMTPEATALVADHGFDPVYGARPLKRAIQHDLLDPLSLKLLEGDFPEGTEIVVREKGGKLDFTKEKK